MLRLRLNLDIARHMSRPALCAVSYFALLLSSAGGLVLSRLLQECATPCQRTKCGPQRDFRGLGWQIYPLDLGITNFLKKKKRCSHVKCDVNIAVKVSIFKWKNLHHLFGWTLPPDTAS